MGHPSMFQLYHTVNQLQLKAIANMHFAEEKYFDSGLDVEAIILISLKKNKNNPAHLFYLWVVYPIC